MKKLILILIFSFWMLGLNAQQQDSGQWVMGIIEGNDTIIHVRVGDVWVFPEKKFSNKSQQRRYSRYVEKVKKVYPLAVEARILLQKYEPVYYSLDNQRDRRKLMKNLEKELLDKHKEDETNRTAYSIIKDFRGEFSAVFWQGIARLFKNNLKDGYDPEEEDKILEEVVRKIEMGYY